MAGQLGRTKPYKTILFDLDDTLLHNPLDRFMRVYLDHLAEYAGSLFDDKYLFWGNLMRCTQQMIANSDRSVTNREVFWRCFSGQTGLDPAETEAYFAVFYRELFPRLRTVTSTKPAAAPLVRQCLALGADVVVATNPLFPLSAIHHRLSWAGLPVNEFPFALVTSYENMHTAKPQSAYYDEILSMVGAAPDDAIMIGDEWENDIVPARTAGLDAFWIQEEEGIPPDPALLVGWGSLEELRTHLFPAVPSK
jgi:FMN phosphatase YigB (HAD superfamily)